MTANTNGNFYGIGVGPGADGLITVQAAEVLQNCQVILCPKANRAKNSVAKDSIAALNLPAERFQIVEYDMEEDRQEAFKTYKKLAAEIVNTIKEGKNVAYLTIGDALTYSTYGYTLTALKALDPNLSITTIPGITSFSLLAALSGYPLGQGKERLLILPCPEQASDLKQDIESHDLVILMKIGRRLPMVLELLHEMDIARHCVLGSRLGLPTQFIETAENLEAGEKGYLSTMLIRKTAPVSPWLHLNHEAATCRTETASNEDPQLEAIQR